MGEVFLDAFLDTLKVLPFLLVMNFLIEFIEYRSKGFNADRILKGKFAPLLGTAVGVVPQCGFSVVATELYSKRKIALGSLLAVYLATSDEALPIMLSSYAGLVKLLPVMLIKICFALIVGYAVLGAEKILSKRAVNAQGGVDEDGKTAHGGVEDDDADISAHAHTSHTDGESGDETDACAHAHVRGCHNHSLDEARAYPKDAGKKQKAAYIWQVFIKHPLIHTLTVIAYIFAVNVVFGIVIYFLGEERIASFIGSTGYLQPVLAALVGFIPNCAASVVITELYIVGGLSLGGTVAGLCMSAGIGYAVLIKQNRPIKDTVIVILLMYVLSVAIGMAVSAIAPLIPVLS